MDHMPEPKPIHTREVGALLIRLANLIEAESVLRTQGEGIPHVKEEADRIRVMGYRLHEMKMTL